MPLPVIADVYRCAIEYSIGGAPCANVIHVHKSVSDASTVGNDVFTAWTGTSGPANRQSNIVAYVRGVCTPLDGTSAPFIQDLSSHAGIHAGGPVAVQACLLTTVETGTRGRSNRGRIYLAGAIASDLDSSAAFWTPAAVIAWTAVWGNFTSALGTSSITLGVASYKNSTFVNQTSMRVNAYLGTQRGRAESLE
jgi:hypothetical protein